MNQALLSFAVPLYHATNGREKRQQNRQTEIEGEEMERGREEGERERESRDRGRAFRLQDRHSYKS